mgnify:CR=1 FL=1
MKKKTRKFSVQTVQPRAIRDFGFRFLYGFCTMSEYRNQ